MAGEKTEGQGLTTADALLFAAAAGVAVGNLYWTQPLLARIAENFGVQASVGGHLMTATQVGTHSEFCFWCRLAIWRIAGNSSPRFSRSVRCPS